MRPLGKLCWWSRWSSTWSPSAWFASLTSLRLQQTIIQTTRRIPKNKPLTLRLNRNAHETVICFWNVQIAFKASADLQTKRTLLAQQKRCSHQKGNPHYQEFYSYVFLRPKCPAGLSNLAQCPCPRETRCKTSCAKRFRLTFILYFKIRQGPRGWSSKGYLCKSKQPISPTLAAGDRTVILI